VQEGKLARCRFPTQWDNVVQWDDVQDEIVLVQEGKIAHAIFPP
jgi:hypothetical protein